MRVSEHPILGQGKPENISIFFDGKPIPAVEGEPIAAALMAAGVRVLRHTEKTGRGRGIFCGIGRCNDCKMIVNGVPNTRTCVTPAQDGMQVETQYGLGKGSCHE